MLWDGFYSVSKTTVPMFMFESLQIQNGITGSLYGLKIQQEHFLMLEKGL
ncbi:MAG: hypothetical protein MR902_07725 [Campylobacter sp.]|nr:hypothetical protein [Campylobacter sp.]